MADSISKSWFAVFDNPEKYGYTGTPQEICEKLRDEWIADSETRSGAWLYCVSAGGLNHVHMVLEDKIAMRFSKINKKYAVGMHFEATKGNKTQAEAYINKQPPFDEKGEEILYICRHGEIQAAQGRRSDLDDISAMLEMGMNPAEIMESDFSYRRYERMIKSGYFAKRFRETPIVRDVSVHYIVGESGSGKSYTYVTLCEEHGADNIYFLSDYDNGGFDNFLGQIYLFMDEYKSQLPFSTLLILTDKYRSQVHARYSNVYCLWSTVYITSVYPPEELYKQMVSEDVRGIDKQQQLFRRITDITYCFVDDAGEYQRFTIPMDTYINYEDLKTRAALHFNPPDPTLDTWQEIESDGDLPFDDESGDLPF